MLQAIRSTIRQTSTTFAILTATVTRPGWQRTASVFSVWVPSAPGYLPPRTPFVGKNFNVTRAGIHADGLLKNEEIYNIFDTEKFLNRPVLCAVSNTSGLAGIAHWINTYYKLPQDKHFDKNSQFAYIEQK